MASSKAAAEVSLYWWNETGLLEARLSKLCIMLFILAAAAAATRLWLVLS
jgi:hypothetical protein